MTEDEEREMLARKSVFWAAVAISLSVVGIVLSVLAIVVGVTS